MLGVLEIFLIILVMYGFFAQRQVNKAKQLSLTEREQLSGLNHRLEAIERRIANLETIVIEKEKNEQFDRALEK